MRGCLVQFTSIFPGAVAAEAEIRVRFAAYKGAHAPQQRHKDAQAA